MTPAIQHDLLTITEPETLRVAADPLRLRILYALENPRTAKELAEAFAVPVTRLYYHINLLTQYGFIQVIETKIISGIPQKRYQLTARRFAVEKSLLERHKNELKRLDEVVGAIFENARHQFRQLITITQTREATSTESVDMHGIGRTMLSQSVLRVTQTEWQELAAQIEALLERYDSEREAIGANDKAAANSTSSSADQLSSFTVALCPIFDTPPVALWLQEETDHDQSR